MEQVHYKAILNTPFRIETSTVQNKPGTWNSTKISIYRDNDFDLKSGIYHKGNLIGEYLRNYSGFGPQTFCPFQIGEEWYALYSANYTATRVLKLHTDRIEDWCGDSSHSDGFYPVEYYIPAYVHTDDDLYYVDGDYEDEFNVIINDPKFVKFDYCNFGFVSGCIWGDDTSWKLRYIDLSKIPDKILSITEKFGYWELPNRSLKQCIQMVNWEPGFNRVTIDRQQNIDLDASS